MPKESSLNRNCAALVRHRGGWARSVPQGIQSAGMSDMIGVYRGVPLVFEMKLPGKENTLTALQAETLAQAKAAGAVARVITRKTDVERILNAIDRKRDR